MGRTANIIINDIIDVFASISKIMRILLMGRRNRERWHTQKNKVYQPSAIKYRMSSLSQSGTTYHVVWE